MANRARPPSTLRAARGRRRGRLLRGLAAAAAAACVAGAALGAAHRAPAPGRAASAPRTAALALAPITLPAAPARLLGQRLMVGFDGHAAGHVLLARVRAGEVGAVILFARNIASPGQVKALTGSLQAAARAGGNPPLLIAVDQEGGQVRRFADAAPDRSPPQIGRSGSTALAEREGRATGAYLRRVGVNWDLAPVADVPTSAGSFIWQEGRAFGFGGAAVARYATAFVRGVQAAGVAATAKHFPGVGSAGVDTDLRLDVLRPSPRVLADGLRPYRALIPAGLETVMLSTAAFPGIDPSGVPAALSQPIIAGLLRRGLGFTGVTVTDDLRTPTGFGSQRAGVLAAAAGADVLLYTGSAGGELGALRAALRAGQIGRGDAEASYRRIVALKQRVAAAR